MRYYSKGHTKQEGIQNLLIDIFKNDKIYVQWSNDNGKYHIKHNNIYNEIIFLKMTIGYECWVEL